MSWSPSRVLAGIIYDLKGTTLWRKMYPEIGDQPCQQVKLKNVAACITGRKYLRQQRQTDSYQMQNNCWAHWRKQKSDAKRLSVMRIEPAQQ